MKRTITLALCLALLFAMTVPASAEGSVHFSISASSGSGYRGDTVTFYINASGGGTCASFGVLISYDSSVFEYVSGSASVSGAAVSSMSSSGLVASYNPTGTPSGTVGSFTLRIRSGAPFGTFSVSGSANASGAGAGASGTSVSVKCNHNYGSWGQYSPDCHQKTCSVCGGTQEEGHSWNEGTVVKEPSCKEEGSKSYTCSVCGQNKDEVLAKTDDHDYGAFTKINDNEHQATCSICGGTLTQGHDWDSGTVTLKETCKSTGTKLFTCGGCDATREDVIPISEVHNYGQWVSVDENTHQHVCSVCQKQEIVDHAWNGGSVTKKPNCIETGTCIYTCTLCGATKTQEMPVTGAHTYDHGCDKDCNICGAVRTTSHSFSSQWSKNTKEHWHVCTSCGEKTDVKAHVPGEEATEHNPQVCTVCGYIIKPELAHEHQFSEEMTTDEEGHWYACSGCEERKDYARHDFDNACDGLCETCGYTRQTEHQISEEWYSDYVNHYQKCVLCGKEEEHIRHTPGPVATETEPQVCEICGFELMPALGHSFHKEWSMDEISHYHLCDCGEKADEQAHSWDEGVRDPDGTLYTCSVCGWQYVQPRDLTWIVYAAAGVLLLGGGAVALLLVKKKKKLTE